MLTAAFVLAALVVGVKAGRNWERTSGRPAVDPVAAAYDTLPAGRPGPVVDTTTGSHDRLPIQPDIRQMLTDYCEGMWQHTQETP